MAYVKPRLLGADNPYGSAHQRERKAWAQYIATHGRVLCRRASNGTCKAESPWITAADTWDLGHPDETCAAPKAPEHALTCNRPTMTRERRAARRVKTRQSRRW